MSEPAAPPARSLRGFRLTTSFSAATTLLGVVSAKVLASFGGQEAVALVSVFRNLGALVSRFLILGMDGVALARISAARSDDERQLVTRAIGAMFGVQAGIILALGLGLLFVPAGATVYGVAIAAHRPALWVTLAMALTNMALQLTWTMLNAVGDIRRAGIANLVAAVSTVLFIYPLVHLGEVGLALTIGAGGFIGTLVGLRFLIRHHRALFGTPAVPDQPRPKLATFSIDLALNPLITMGAILYAQGAVAAHYGVKGLGSYAAATLILDTAGVVIMSAARSHVLPTLARAKTSADKSDFLAYALTFFNSAATVAAVGLIVGAPLIVAVLFGAKFTSLRALIAVMALCLAAQAVEYTVSALLNSQRRFRLALIADSAGGLAYVAAVLICVRLDARIEFIGVAYGVGHVAGAAVYLALAVLSGEGVHVRRRSLGFIAICAGCAFLVYFVNQRSVMLGAILAALVGAYFARRIWAMRAGERP